MDPRGFKQFRELCQNAPRSINYGVSNVLTSLAFKTREYDLKNIADSMIVRNPRFVASSIKVTKARNTRIEQQIAEVYSIKRERFTGWEEQQEGKTSTSKHAPTLAARAGNKRAQMIQRARMRSSNKFYKPAQFQAHTLKGSFMFMLRVLGSRGGGEFMLSENIPTKRGSMAKGLYQFRQHKIKRLQKTDAIKQPRINRWRTRSLTQLRSGNDIDNIWRNTLQSIYARMRR